MQLWQYSSEVFYGPEPIRGYELKKKPPPAGWHSWDKHQEIMDAKGAEAWECYAVIESPGGTLATFYFKRPFATKGES